MHDGVHTLRLNYKARRPMRISGSDCLVLLLVGCIGDPAAVRTVSLTFPRAGPDRSFSVSAPELQEALGIIDDTLVAGGFPRSAHQPPPNDQGMIVGYGVGNVYLTSN